MDKCRQCEYFKVKYSGQNGKGMWGICDHKPLKPRLMGASKACKDLKKKEG